MAAPESSRTTPRTLSHFALLRFTSAYWQLDAAARRQQRRALWDGLAGVADVLHLYQVFPLHDSADLLLWTALRSAEPDRVHSYFRDFAAVLAPLRPLLKVKQPLWGFTRPSTYTKDALHAGGRSVHHGRTQALPGRCIPFVKTSAWYALSRDTRQGMMNGHIRVGKEYPGHHPASALLGRACRIRNSWSCTRPTTCPASPTW